MRGFSLPIKRLMDIVISATGTVLCLPLAVVIGVLIKLESRGPIFFRQERTGKAGVAFQMLKFRTMIQGAEAGGLEVRQADPRVTRIGHYLRSFSIDELPQLLNVFRGEMSLVGPRPLLPAQTAGFTTEERVRLEMSPGMTNLPAIKGRNSLSWDDRMRLDRWYVENWSLLLDLEILFKTPWYVVCRTGVYSASDSPEGNRE